MHDRTVLDDDQAAEARTRRETHEIVTAELAEQGIDPAQADPARIRRTYRLLRGAKA